MLKYLIKLYHEPKLAEDYNNKISVVDRLYQHLHGYPVTRKGVKNVIRKIFHLLDISLYNTFVLYKKMVAGKTTWFSTLRLLSG